ncbi:DoxX family protein [Pontibacter litorisediminis]|uniref:DoxX family protein n=1 Tax=Pontibacter litorisediminis TaxID=1846260 RepID=UPI0023ECBF89|nr:DoxX family protein [Pontibacter litorisediminis]
MERFLGTYSPHLYALLRIVAGLLFAMHGTQKLFGWPGGGDTVELASQMGIAGIIELVGGLLIAFGFLTSWAAFIASGEMAAAYFIAHAPQAAWPIENQGEMAVVYCFLFLYMAARGAGIWSVDAALHRGPQADVTATHRVT